MTISSIACPKCKLPVPREFYNRSEPVPCVQCGTLSQTEIFPALLKTIESSQAEKLKEDSQASCFYHADKKADQVCDSCGCIRRFLPGGRPAAFRDTR